MAGLEIGRNAVLLIEKRKIVRRHDADLEPMDAEIIGISLAAAALRVLIEGHLLAIVSRSGGRRYDDRGASDKCRQDRSAVYAKPLWLRVAQIDRVVPDIHHRDPFRISTGA